MIAAPGLLLAVLAGLVFAPEVPQGQPYLQIAVVADQDAVFAALRASLDVSFVSNVVIAVFGIRIFSNVATNRRHYFHA